MTPIQSSIKNQLVGTGISSVPDLLALEVDLAVLFRDLKSLVDSSENITRRLREYRQSELEQEPVDSYLMEQA